MALDWLVGHVCGDIHRGLRTSLIESSEEIEAVAKQVVDRYWLAFRPRTRARSTYRKTNECWVGSPIREAAPSVTRSSTSDGDDTHRGERERGEGIG